MPPPFADPVWRAAPTVLLRFRSLFAALAVGAFLVAVVSAAYPSFLSASQSDLVASAVENPTVTPYGMGFAYKSTDVRPSQRGPGGGVLWREREASFTEETGAIDLLAPTQAALFGGVVSVGDAAGDPPPTGPAMGRLFAGTDVLDHVEIIDGEDGPGVWLPDLVATPLGAGPGDEVTLSSPAGSVRVPVDGVYVSLYTQPREGYWRLWDDQIYAPPCVRCGAPPQLLLADRDQVLEWSEVLGFREMSFAWQAPAITDPPLTLADAESLSASTGELLDRMSGGGDLARLFRCCGQQYLRGGPTDIVVSRNADLVVEEVRQRVAAIEGPLVVLLVAGLAIALAVVAAAGVFSVAGRRVEMGVLTIRGWSPGAYGAKAAIEAALPAVLGGALGWVVATFLVAAVGPDGPVDPRARATSLAAAAVAVVASIAIVGTVSGASFVARHEHRHRITRILAAVPWELGAFVAAWMLARRLETGGVIEEGGIQRPRPEVFLFPLLLALGAGILCARLARIGLRFGVRERGERASAPWLALRRLRSGAALTALFLVAGILTVSVSTSALGTVASLRGTVEAKAKVFVGSDVQVQVARGAQTAADFPYPVTMVTRFKEAGSLDETDLAYDLLAVDTDTFEDTAYWNDAFADEPLGELLDRLADADGAGLPVVVAGVGADPSSIILGQERVPVSVVGTASSFPGTSTDSRPVLVVSEDRLAEALRGPDPLASPRATHEIWVEGPTRAILDRIDDLGVRPLLVIDAEGVEDVPFIDAAVQTFVVMQVLGLASIALLVVVAVVYLYAKQRSRAVATVLSDRMGMRPSTMRAASVVELGAMLAAAFVAGTLVGVVAISVVVPSLDPLPSIPPDPLIVVPTIALACTAAALAAAAIVGGAIADRGARQTSTAEVMRVAE